MALLIPAADLIYEFIIQRTAGLLAGDDRSGSLRWLGSYDTMVFALRQSPLLGSGIGFLDILPSINGIEFSYQTDVQEFVTSTGNIQIVPFYFLGALGPLGLIIFILMVLE